MKRRNMIKLGTGSAAGKRQKMVTESIASSIVNNNENPPLSEKINASVEVLSLCTLNHDCLRNIMDYLSVPDLFNMCIASNQLKEVVIENGLKGRLFDFGDIAHCCHILDVFKIFGQHITNIKIGERDIQYKERSISKFDEILRLISTYCFVDTLKCVDIQYYNATCINKRFMDASIQYLKCIESFILFETDLAGEGNFVDYFDAYPICSPSVNDFVERVVENARMINSIKLHNLRISGHFFNLDHIRNLQNVSLIGCHLTEPDGLLSFIQKKPKLKSFGLKDSSLRGMDSSTSHSSNCVYGLVTANIPDLEAFHYDPNEGFINNQNKYDMSSIFILPNFQLLAKFNKLKIFKAHGMTVDGLKLLAQQNTVEKLYTGFSRVDDYVIDWNFVLNFRSLKYIQLFTCTTEDVREFNKQLLSKLPNLSECDLDFTNIVADVIEKVVESARNLSILRISFRCGSFTSDMYLRLVFIRLKLVGIQGNPLVICIKNEFVAQLLSVLGQNYSPQAIAFKSYNQCY